VRDSTKTGHRPTPIHPPVPSATTAFVVFARDPQLGRVKTRLAATLGDARALDIYLQLGTRTIAAVARAAARRAGSRIVIAHTCEGDTSKLRDWLGTNFEYRPQCTGDLGARMAAAIATEVSRGRPKVIVVGTDCPDLDAEVLCAAAAALESADVVLGPAADGGYYLIAVRAPHPALFDDIPWSSADTLRVTLSAARRAGLTVTLLDERTDIDTAGDWNAWATRDDYASAVDPGAAR
jgi:Uncharacterized protein conserved in bacteria